jgi:histidinol-phosphatase
MDSCRCLWPAGRSYIDLSTSDVDQDGGVSTTTERTRDLALALELADLADQVSMARFRSSDLAVDAKADGSPVTDADRAIELAWRRHLERAAPGDAFVGEEFGHRGDDRRVWMVDPIDGTKAFARGEASWAALIGLCEDAVPVVGVVSAPAIGRRWWGAVGQGAWLDGSPISVSLTPTLNTAVVCDDHRQSVERKVSWNPLVAIADACALVEPHGPFGLLRVAQGTLDLTFGWYAGNGPDLASHVAILLAAGGRFGDLDDHVNIYSEVWLASNGALHDAALTIARDVVASGRADPHQRPVD